MIMMPEGGMIGPMTDEAARTGAHGAHSEKRRNPLAGFFAATEVDTRMLGLIVALGLIWIGFHVGSGGVFLTPRNLWNLSVQTASTAGVSGRMVLPQDGHSMAASRVFISTRHSEQSMCQRRPVFQPLKRALPSCKLCCHPWACGKGQTDL